MNTKVLAIIVGAILVLAVLVGLSSTGNEDNPQPGQLSTHQWGESSGEDQLFFIEGIDFECPACAQFHPLAKHLREQYSDHIVFVVRHYPLRAIHLNAAYVHRAAEAAAKQGKFWEMHDLLFEQRDLWVNQPDLRVDPAPAVEKFARELDLDWEQFQADFSSSEINDIINNDIQWLNQYTERQSTPTFLLQRGVDGPVEAIPTDRLNSQDKAISLFDSWLDDRTEADDTTTTSPDSEATPEET